MWGIFQDYIKFMVIQKMTKLADVQRVWSKIVAPIVDIGDIYVLIRTIWWAYGVLTLRNMWSADIAGELLIDDCVNIGILPAILTLFAHIQQSVVQMKIR